VKEVEGTPNEELTERCPDRLTVLPEEPCTNQSCPWSIAAPIYRNCSFVVFQAVDATGNKLSLEEIGEMEGITREGVRQIELRALRKLRQRLSLAGDPEARLPNSALLAAMAAVG
jgi:hypothetical protein